MASNTHDPKPLMTFPRCRCGEIALWTVVLRYKPEGAAPDSTVWMDLAVPGVWCERCAVTDQGDKPYLTDDMFNKIAGTFSAMNLARPDRGTCIARRNPLPDEAYTDLIG